ncbi:YceI family protein [Maricaulis sp. CAU 1757]
MIRTLLVPLLSAATLSAPALAQDWVVDRAASSVTFVTTALGSEINGRFETWQADITLDPADLATASIEAAVMTASGATGNGEIDSAMRSEAGLAPASHAAARFVSDSIEATADGYLARGTLTLRDQSRPAELPFTLAINGDRAVADGHLDITRADFGIGASSWGAAAAEVRVQMHIEADAAQ